MYKTYNKSFTVKLSDEDVSLLQDIILSSLYETNHIDISLEDRVDHVLKYITQVNDTNGYWIGYDL